MKTKLAQVLSRFVNHREVVVWGNPTRLMQRDFSASGYPFRVAPEDAPLERARHYVIFPSEGDREAFFWGGDHGAYNYWQDCWQYDDVGGELPFDWALGSAAIGKWSYFGDGVASAIANGYVERIGRFASINGKAVIHVDHQFNMVFVSDEVVNLFSEEDKALFDERLLADAKLPGTANKSRGLVIGNDVWIGANAFINCSKVKYIGDGAMIGSGAVVIGDVPPYAVVVGVPAKIKRYRFTPEQVEKLLDEKWWDWDDAAIRANAGKLICPERFFGAGYENRF